MSVKGLIAWTASILIGVVLVFYKGKHSGILEEKLEELKKEKIHNDSIKRIRKKNSGLSRDSIIAKLRGYSKK